MKAAKKSWLRRRTRVSYFPAPDVSLRRSFTILYVANAQKLHIAVFSISSERKRTRRERKRGVERKERRGGGWLRAGTGGKAREKREVMSSAFAQPLTGLYEPVEYIHAARWKPAGNTLGSYVTLLRHFAAREWYLRAIERAAPSSSASRFFSALRSPGHTIPSPCIPFLYTRRSRIINNK